MEFNAQNFGFQQPQPINTVNSNTETAYASTHAQQNGTQGDAKVRFTRAERRAFAKEKRAAQGPRKATHKRDLKGDPKRDHRKSDIDSKATVDDVIALLLTIRGKEGRQSRSSLTRITRSLESRITRDPAAGVKKDKKELSTKKLEKLAKRKELRAEKRKARRAERAEQNGGSAVEQEPKPQADGVPSIQEIEDEITFDE